MNWTSGPWHEGGHSKGQYFGSVWNNDAIQIAHVFGGVEVGNANTRLIAAAPDLYEALEACEKHLRDLFDSHDGCRADLNMADIAEAALAKARGEEMSRNKGA